MKSPVVITPLEARAAEEMGLSPREIQVMRLAAEGQINKEIARTLSISEQTAKNILSHIYRKMHLLRRAQLTARYIAACGIPPAHIDNAPELYG